MTETTDPLESTLAEVEWTHIQPHAKQGRVILLDGDLDILEIGQNFADDNAEKIKQLIEQKKMKKLEKKEVEEWSENPKLLVKSLIVDPFVLIQKISPH